MLNATTEIQNKRLIPFQEVTESDVNLIGGKALSLVKMTQAGLPVPPGSILPSSCYTTFLATHKELLAPLLIALYQCPAEEWLDKSNAVRTAIESGELATTVLADTYAWLESLIAAGFTSVAVRSSCNFEDTVGASFAGQYDTVLNVSTQEGLKKAILQCWASVYNERVLSYCQQQRIDHREIEMALVIQAFVPAEAAGVLFTVDPLSGKDSRMIIEAVSGVGETLVQGTVTPDTYAYDWFTEEVEFIRTGEQEKGLFSEPGQEGIHWRTMDAEIAILQLEQIRQLGVIALQAQNLYGFPIDIEWAWLKGEFFLLQARPITQIRFAATQNWTNADFKDGGIASSIPTPFMWSLYRWVFSQTMPQYLKKIHIYPDYEPSSWAEAFLGYPYWNLSAVKNGASKVPGFKERKFDQDLGIEPDYAGDGQETKFTPRSIIRGVRILQAIGKSVRNRVKRCEQLQEYVAAYISDFQDINLLELSNDALLEISKELILKHYIYVESTYFFTIYDNSNVTTLFHEAIEKYNKSRSEKVNYLQLIGGLEDLSHLRPMYDLWNIRTAILKNDEARDYYQNHSKATILGDLDSGKIFPLRHELRAYLKRFNYHSKQELDILTPHWGEDASQVIESLKSILAQSDEHSPLGQNRKQKAKYDTEFKRIRSRRVQKKLNQHRQLLWWREETRDASTKMYYCIRQIGLEWGRRLTKQGLIEAPEDIFFLNYEQALQFWAGKDINEFQRLISKEKSRYQSFRNFQPPNEIWNKSRTQLDQRGSDKNGLSGIPCSSGQIRGVVCVVKNISEVDELPAGAILVTRFTDPAWTPVFAMISGLITETGGLLSHGAVVSREYGIPAVLAVKNATVQLTTGMEVILDGDEGTVEVVTTD